MKVTLTIPQDLQRYIEYIPDETLQEVLIDMIRSGILKKSTTSNQSNEKYEELKQLIMSIANNYTPTAGYTQPKQDAKQEVEKKAETIINYVKLNPIEGLEDMDDLLDMLK